MEWLYYNANDFEKISDGKFPIMGGQEEYQQKIQNNSVEVSRYGEPGEFVNLKSDNKNNILVPKFEERVDILVDNKHPEKILKEMVKLLNQLNNRIEYHKSAMIEEVQKKQLPGQLVLFVFQQPTFKFLDNVLSLSIQIGIAGGIPETYLNKIK